MKELNQPKKKVIKKIRNERPESTPLKTKVLSKAAKSKRDLFISELAARWNYALPAYPPKGFDY